MKRFLIFSGLLFASLSGSFPSLAQPAHFPFLKPGLSTLLEYGSGGQARLVVLPRDANGGYPVNFIFDPDGSSEFEIPDWGLFYVLDKTTLCFGNAGSFATLGTYAVPMKLYSIDSKAGEVSTYLIGNDSPEENCPEDYGVWERTIVSMNETVTTKGGTFENCVHVRQVPRNEPRAVFELYIDRQMGIVRMVTTVIEGDCHEDEERQFMPMTMELVK